MLSDGVSEHQILKIFLGGGACPQTPLDGPLTALVPPHSKTTSFAYAIIRLSGQGEVIGSSNLVHPNGENCMTMSGLG